MIILIKIKSVEEFQVKDICYYIILGIKKPYRINKKLYISYETRVNEKIGG